MSRVQRNAFFPAQEQIFLSCHLELGRVNLSQLLRGQLCFQ